MNKQEFADQLNRLAGVFGATSYPEERRRVLWNEVQDLSGNWFAGVVTNFIGELRMAPLLKEFREEISKERERVNHVKKREYAKGSAEIRASYSNEEIKSMSETIRNIMLGAVPPEHVEAFVKVTEHVAKEGESK